MSAIGLRRIVDRLAHRPSAKDASAELVDAFPGKPNVFVNDVAAITDTPMLDCRDYG
jgi:hypothetical protein